MSDEIEYIGMRLGLHWEEAFEVLSLWQLGLRETSNIKWHSLRLGHELRYPALRNYDEQMEKYA